jgi:hypothetical protein
MNRTGQASLELLMVCAAVLSFSVVFGTALYNDYTDTQTLINTKSLLVPQLNTLKQGYYIQHIRIDKLPVNRLEIHVATIPSTLQAPPVSGPCPATAECLDVTSVQDTIQAQRTDMVITLFLNA